MHDKTSALPTTPATCVEDCEEEEGGEVRLKVRV